MPFDERNGSLRMTSPPSMVAGVLRSCSAPFNDAGPFGYTEVDVTGTVRVSTPLATSNQLKLTDVASAKEACSG